MNTLGFTIDLAVPIPARKGRLRKCEWTKWPFAELEVGDSFSAPGNSTTAYRAASEYASNNPPKRFACRWFDEDPVTKKPGTRVWRIR